MAVIWSRAGSAVIPTNVRVTGVGATDIAVTWNGVAHCRQAHSGVVGYRVQLSPVSGGGVQYEEAAAPEALLTGLTPFNNYSIAVAAVNKEGLEVGPYSQSLTVQTDEHSEFEMYHHLLMCLHTCYLSSWSSDYRASALYAPNYNHME